MGPKNCETEDLVLYTADGEKIGKIWDLAEATVQAGKEITSVMCPAMVDLYMEIIVKPARNWFCRSRKRFIKLLMSKGISRNEAESVAKVARIAGCHIGSCGRAASFGKGVIKVEHLGDITKLNGYELPPVDVVIGGSPC